MQYNLVTTQQALVAFCEQALQQSAIAVDTEFVRTRTLYPRLGLIQIYDGISLVLIDPLAIQDMAPLVALLANENVVKVMHSCSEDLETFWHSLNVIPKPIFDTQFAACLLDMGSSLGYANLIESMLAVSLDKGESRTDWIARPLTEQQCVYAANDVLYLLQVYPELNEKIKQLGRLEWVFDEMQQLAKKKTTPMPAELAYLTIKNNWKLRDLSLHVLKLLAKWRLEQARQRDLALNFVVREANLVEVARALPSHKGAVFAIEGMSPQEARIHGDALIDIVNESKKFPAEAYPTAISRLMERPRFKKVAAEIRALCQKHAQALAIPVEVLGSKKQIQQCLKYHWKIQDELHEMGLLPDLLSGWRNELLGDELTTILNNNVGE